MEPGTRAPGRPDRRWLNSTVLGIGLASLFSDVGHEMATAAMPALLATLGASSALLGVIEGVADGLSSFAKLLSGLYSDRLRRRKPLAVVARPPRPRRRLAGTGGAHPGEERPPHRGHHQGDLRPRLRP